MLLPSFSSITIATTTILNAGSWKHSSGTNLNTLFSFQNLIKSKWLKSFRLERTIWTSSQNSATKITFICFFLGGGKKDKNLKHSNKKVEYTNESVYN